MWRASKRIRIACAVGVAALLSGVLLAGCAQLFGPPTNAVTGKPIDLKAVEIRDYQGKKLDSVGGIPENSIKGPQKVPLGSYRLKITGRVATPLALTYDQVVDRQQYRKVVTLNCVEGWSVTILWQGVRLVDLLEQAGYDPNAKVVIFRCYDGYTTSLPLSKIVNENLLFAYKMNGVPLPEERGFPFQLIAEDQWGYKWAKWVTEIEVSDDAAFRGYWESRGYADDATLPQVPAPSAAETVSPPEPASEPATTP